MYVCKVSTGMFCLGFSPPQPFQNMSIHMSIHISMPIHTHLYALSHTHTLMLLPKCRYMCMAIHFYRMSVPTSKRTSIHMSINMSTHMSIHMSMVYAQVRVYGKMSGIVDSPLPIPPGLPCRSHDHDDLKP